MTCVAIPTKAAFPELFARRMLEKAQNSSQLRFRNPKAQNRLICVVMFSYVLPPGTGNSNILQDTPSHFMEQGERVFSRDRC